MRNRWMKKLLLIPATVFAFISCQKDFSIDGGGNNTNVDLTTKVTAKMISGFVTDENDAAVAGALVTIGTQTTTTDEYGYFEAKNIAVSKNAATVTVNQPGYFPGIRTFMAAAGKDNFVRIKLLAKTNSGNISAANGGSVTLTNGLKIALPANAVVNATSGVAYSGTINVAAQWINPQGTDRDLVMPGDLRAIDAADNMKLLTTYGMAAVELTGSGGEKLQVAPGKKAMLTMPLPASIAGIAPASIPLWHFDEAKGLWIEEGSAIKVGNTYEGEVSHFSFWNCDVPNDYIQLDLTLHNAAGQPIRYAYVRVINTANNQWATGVTDSLGYVKGAVPANTQLRVEVNAGYYCSTPWYTQTVTAGSTNISLGTITINNTANDAHITGTATNCSGAALTNGAVLLHVNNMYQRFWVSPDGTFDFYLALCNTTSSPASIVVEDLTAGQQSAVTNVTINAGNNNLGNIQACGTSTAQFVNLSVNGTPYSFTDLTDSLSYNNTATGAGVWAVHSSGTGTASSVEFAFSNTSMGVGSSQALAAFSTSHIPGQYNIPFGNNVTITEYGAIGEFIAGNFTLTATGTTPPNTVYSVTCSFRIRRYN